MPLKNGRLTPKERAVVAGFVATGDPREAARRAGLAQPQTAGYHVVARPAVQAEVFRLQMERLTNEAMPLAIDTLIACMRSDKAPWAAKNQAAKIALDHTAGREGAGGVKPDHELTMDEINAKIAALEARKVERATPVDVEDVSFTDPPAAGVFG